MMSLNQIVILDGYPDDYDDSDDADACASGGDSSAAVLEVDPENDTDLTDDDDLVSLDKEVKIRFSCSLNTSTVNASTVDIASDSHTVSCALSLSNNDTRITCDHDGDPFDANTVYTATLNGVECSNGDSIPTTTWSWKTETD